jgi:RNA polymerase sigma factor (TIGR02999 family)
MSEVTRILSQIERGDPKAADQLLPLVYDELRKLASQRLGKEEPGQTLQATALVHEAYVRLVSPPSSAKPDITDQPDHWNSRGHFFAAAAEAMRRILVDHARHKGRLKRGGSGQRLELSETQAADSGQSDLVLAVDDSLAALAEQNAQAAELVKLRFFAGLTLPEAAAAIDVSPRTADRLWAYAKAFLHQRLQS